MGCGIRIVSKKNQSTIVSKKQQSSKRLTNNGPLRGASFETSSILRLIFSQFGKMVAPPFPDRTVPDWPKVPKNGSE